MRFGNATVDARIVFRIMASTLMIAAALDLVSTWYIGWRIPWYSTTAVITLFMYACESSLNYHDRAAFAQWQDEVEKRLGDRK